MVSTDALDPRILNTDSYQMDPNNMVIVEEEDSPLPDTTQSTKMAESSKSRTLETVPEETKF
jgi:hypothetical protein